MLLTGSRQAYKIDKPFMRTWHLITQRHDLVTKLFLPATETVGYKPDFADFKGFSGGLPFTITIAYRKNCDTQGDPCRGTENIVALISERDTRRFHS